MTTREPFDSTANFVRDDRATILKGFGWSSLGFPAAMALAFAAQVLVARLVSPDEFGSYALAVSIYSSVALACQLGIPQTLLRRASAALSSGDPMEAGHEVFSAFVVTAVAALMSFVLLASPLGMELLGDSFPDTAVASVAALIGLNAALRVFENLTPEAFRAYRDFLRASLYRGFLANLLYSVTLLILLIVSGKTSLSAVLTASAACSAAALLPALGGLAKRVAHGTSGPRHALRNPVEPAMWLSSIGSVVVAQLDLWVIGALGTSNDLALYSAPFRLALLVGIPLLVVNQVVSPLIAGWHTRGENARLEQTLQSAAAVAVLAAGVVAVLFVVAGGPLLELLFGTYYSQASGVLAILSVGQLLQTSTGANSYALLMTGHHRANALILTVSSVFTLALDIALFEAAGIDGVALATAVAFVLQNLAQTYFARRLAGINTLASPRALARQLWRRQW
jgi:O-antigen/teichoic acid export membrane protein